MKIFDSEFLHTKLATENYLLKLIANESAAFFFDSTIQHRDAKQLGLSYEHDSKGNAIAGILRPGLLEFRFHQSFSEERVSNIARSILNCPLARLSAEMTVTYQGNQLSL